MVAMLTKQEREEIAERFRNYDKAEYVTLYSGMYDGLLGEHVPKETTVKKDRMELASRILDLCDTSNMVELPLDKDGKVIHIGDVVYTSDGEEHKMAGYIMRKNTTEIILSVNSEGTYITTSANNITHKKPVTIASLIKELTDIVAADYGTPMVVKRKLSDIADQLKKLGDSDD